MRDGVGMIIEKKGENQEEKNQEEKNRDQKDYALFVAGDNQAFERLVLLYKDHLIFFLNRLVQNVTIAEDLAQDAFVEILLHKERYHYQVSFKTYLFTIGRNKAVDYIRKNKRMTLLCEFPDQASEERELEERVMIKEDIHCLYHALKGLKKEYGEAITLVDLEGLSYAQTAKVLGKSEVQIKILIHRARKSLAKLMEKEGFTYEK